MSINPPSATQSPEMTPVDSSAVLEEIELPPVATAPVVVSCYAFLDRAFPALGFLDMTEGMYEGDAGRSYAEAQRRQLDYLLDEVRCGPGMRLLELGCGNGTLLAAATERGATAVGITISPEQVRRCTAQGLDARLVNYREMPGSWEGVFDAIIANGSIEHFVQPADDAAGRADALYREMFRICRRLLNPRSASRRLATTIIHFARPIEGEQMGRKFWTHRPGSDAFHFALLSQAMGGYYPRAGQLAHCAKDCFELVREVDGTQDYHLTSEHWLRGAREYLRGLGMARALGRTAPVWARHPLQSAQLMLCFVVAQSWAWQFRGDAPPTRLLRQTWECRAR